MLTKTKSKRQRIPLPHFRDYDNKDVFGNWFYCHSEEHDFRSKEICLLCPGCQQINLMRYFMDCYGQFYLICPDCCWSNQVSDPKNFAGYVGSSQNKQCYD